VEALGRPRGEIDAHADTGARTIRAAAHAAADADRRIAVAGLLDHRVDRHFRNLRRFAVDDHVALFLELPGDGFAEHIELQRIGRRARPGPHRDRPGAERLRLVAREPGDLDRRDVSRRAPGEEHGNGNNARVNKGSHGASNG